MRSRLWILAAVIGLLGTGGRPVAHHALSAEYDVNKPITLTGVVTKIEWLNPHARFYLDVKDGRGAVVSWNLQLASPNGLVRNGWSRKTLNVGDEVTVEGWMARDGSKMANAHVVKLADGRRVSGAGPVGNGPAPQ